MGKINNIIRMVMEIHTEGKQTALNWTWEHIKNYCKQSYELVSDRMIDITNETNFSKRKLVNSNILNLSKPVHKLQYDQKLTMNSSGFRKKKETKNKIEQKDT